MKKTILFLLISASVYQISSAQIIDSLPYFKQDFIVNNTLQPFFQGVVYFTAGVADFTIYAKKRVDPDFTPPTKGWIRDSMFNHLASYYLGQAYTSAGGFKSMVDAFEAITLERGIHSVTIDSCFVYTIFELKEGQSIQNRGAFDPLRAYDLNPNDLSYKAGIEKILPKRVMQKVKADPKYLRRVFGLQLVEKPDGKYKISPVADPAVTMVMAGGWPYNPAQASYHAHGFKGSDEELQALKLAQTLLKSIRQNDPQSFRMVFDEDLVRSEAWKDIRLQSIYQKLPEYSSQGLDFEKVVSFENQAGWSGHFAFYVVVYRLPEGMKASELRAPSDLFNALHWEGANLQDLESQDKIKALKAGFAPMSENSIFLGPLIGTIVHEHQNPQNYITVLVVKEPGTNNFNIGMPPTFK